MFLVSACLVGLNTKYDGTNNLNPRVLEFLKDKLFIPICPEQLGGLPTPRLPAEIISYPQLKVINIKGEDVTSNFFRGAQETLKIAQFYENKLSGIILKEKSPSCGVNYIYDGSFQKRLIPGMGVTARLLFEHGFKLFTEKSIGREADGNLSWQYFSPSE
ncbi:DUF523 domain-containing protein [Carboxydothermus ferrireducens]|uniref:DUF523 domain-containing protein n=1 Tax=Carboxydothermus ferrireducens TaxID=54265 RepID=UPI000686125F|nr:DUF523 domain-containing protein [Carboxydothermus ferrireducens]